MKFVKVPANGRVTIPKDLRKKLKLNPGTKITFIERDGFVFIQPLNRKYFDDVARPFIAERN
jgi:AbrB family looped-hinge helix DNA binding protein